MGLYERGYYQESEPAPNQPFHTRSIVIILIIVNVAVFLADFLIGPQKNSRLSSWFILHGDVLNQPLQWYRLLTNGFLHGDISHILFNMLSLFFLGQMVENRYGRMEFLRIYLIAIVVGSIAWAVRLQLMEPAEVLPLIGLLGASGAVTAVTMLFVFNFPNMTLSLWGIVPVKAWALGVFIVLYNLLGNSNLILMDGQRSKPIAYDVHLAGAALAAAYFYGRVNFGDWGARIKQLVFLSKQPKLKIRRPEESAIADRLQNEADRILEKLHLQGQDSLTVKERKTLEEYSRAVRKMRQH